MKRHEDAAEELVVMLAAWKERRGFSDREANFLLLVVARTAPQMPAGVVGCVEAAVRKFMEVVE